jgi:hypothetical protein
MQPRRFDRRMSLRLPSEPEFAVTVRTFVATGARYFGVAEDVTEDLRLAASELFAHAVQGSAGEVSFTMNGEDGRVDLDMSGAPPLSEAPGDSPSDDPEGWLATHRLTLLRAIAEVQAVGADVRVSVPSD